MITKGMNENERDFHCKSIEEAKHLAAEKFGVSEDQIVYRILEEPKRDSSAR